MRAAWIWLLVLAACGDDLRGVEPADYEAALTDARCRYLARCGALPLETCLETNLYPNAGAPPAFEAAIRAGTVVWHAGTIFTCLEREAAASCDPAEPAHDPPCGTFWEGTLHAGDTCTLDGECRSRWCALEDCADACCTGVCIADAPAGHIAFGESCASGSCADGFCDRQFVCTPRLAEGNHCEADDECVRGLGCIDQICTALPGRNEPCVERCRLDGDHCSTITQTCVPGGFLGDHCAGDRDCSTFYTCEVGRCTAAELPLGAHCSPGDRCSDPDAVCNQVTETCELPKPIGAPCSSWQECASHTCYGTTFPAPGTCVGCVED